jgi:hypothetical protein
MTASVLLPKMDYGFRCGSFLESDVANNKYSFTVDIPFMCNDNLTGMVSQLFVIGKGPNHMTTGWSSEDAPLDLIVFHSSFFMGKDAPVQDFGIGSEIRTANTKTNRNYEQNHNRKIVGYDIEGATKIKITVSFVENKDYSRENYEYRYFVWFNAYNAYNSLADRANISETEWKTATTSGVTSISNKLSAKIGYPFGLGMRVVLANNPDKKHASSTPSSTSFPYNSIFIPNSLKNNSFDETNEKYLNCKDFICIVYRQVNASSSSSYQTYFDIFSPWLKSKVTEEDGRILHYACRINETKKSLQFVTYMAETYGSNKPMLSYYNTLSSNDVSVNMYWGLFNGGTN